MRDGISISKEGAVVVEVNSSPGLEGLENATGIDVAGKIIEFVELNARPGRTRTKISKRPRKAAGARAV